MSLPLSVVVPGPTDATFRSVVVTGVTGTAAPAPPTVPPALAPIGRPRLMAPVVFAGGITGGPSWAGVGALSIWTRVVGETSLLAGTIMPCAWATSAGGICPLRPPLLTEPSARAPAVV